MATGTRGTDVIGGSPGEHNRRRRRPLLAGLGVAAALVVALAGWMPAAGASAGTGEPRASGTVPVTGDFGATGHFDLFECGFAHEFLAGTGSWSGLGAVKMEFEFCVDGDPTSPEPWDVTRGSFTITAASGTLTGDIDGEISNQQHPPEGLTPGTLIFTITGGTGDLEGATGSLVLDVLLRRVEPNGRKMVGTGGGTLTLPDQGNG